MKKTIILRLLIVCFIILIFLIPTIIIKLSNDNTQTPSHTPGNIQTPSPTPGNIQTPLSTPGNIQTPLSTPGNIQTPSPTPRLPIRYTLSICNGRGYMENEKCICNINSKGENCQYSDMITCNGKGSVNENGVCSCNPGWKGSGCQYSDMITCNGKGTVNENGVCSCISGWKGGNCEYGDDTTCLGRGTVNGNGTCNCRIGFKNDTNCSTCTTGYNGAECQYSNKKDCGNEIIAYGTVSNTGKCTCFTGYNGDKCQFSNDVTCNGKGTVNENGVCSCNPGWGGNNCSSCADGWRGNSCQYSNAIDCNGNGIVDFNGICTCINGWKGDKCQYHYITTCSGRATSVSNLGTCTCRTGWGGSNCSTCENGYNGDRCQYSNAIDCNGNGIVQTNGTCVCNQGYNGNKCQYSNAIDCNQNGTVNGNGICSCNSGYAGSKCQYNSQINCNGRGIVKSDEKDDPYCECINSNGSRCQFCNTDKGYMIKDISTFEGKCSCVTPWSGDYCTVENTGITLTSDNSLNFKLKQSPYNRLPPMEMILDDGNRYLFLEKNFTTLGWSFFISPSTPGATIRLDGFGNVIPQTITINNLNSSTNPPIQYKYYDIIFNLDSTKIVDNNGVTLDTKNSIFTPGKYNPWLNIIYTSFNTLNSPNDMFTIMVKSLSIYDYNRDYKFSNSTYWNNVISYKLTREQSQNPNSKIKVYLSYNSTSTSINKLWVICGEPIGDDPTQGDKFRLDNWS